MAMVSSCLIASTLLQRLKLLLTIHYQVVFLMFGKSMVTGAQIFFHLREDRI